jgi:hypothetical protein
MTFGISTWNLPEYDSMVAWYSTVSNLRMPVTRWGHYFHDLRPFLCRFWERPCTFVTFRFSIDFENARVLHVSRHFSIGFENASVPFVTPGVPFMTPQKRPRQIQGTCQSLFPQDVNQKYTAHARPDTRCVVIYPREVVLVKRRKTNTGWRHGPRSYCSRSQSERVPQQYNRCGS